MPLPLAGTPQTVLQECHCSGDEKLGLGWFSGVWGFFLICFFFFYFVSFVAIHNQMARILSLVF